MTKVSPRGPRANNTAVLAGLLFVSGIALGIQAAIPTGSGDVKITHPVELLADNDAGPPPENPGSKSSPTLPLPPPVAPIAMADPR